MKSSQTSLINYIRPYGYIYVIENITNHKKYIGKTIKKNGIRWIGTLKFIKNEYNIHLYNSVLKYGIENFKAKILDRTINKEDLNKKEMYYIKKYNTCDKKYGYNKTFGGDGGEPTDEAKKNMRKKHKPMSDETKKKISKSNKGKLHPWNKDRKNREGQRKRKYTIEQIKRLFLEKNLLCLEDKYISINNSLKYKCLSCGYEGQKSLNNYLHGQMNCKSCSKKNHPSWNKGLKNTYHWGHHSKETKEKLSKMMKVIQIEVQNRPEIKAKISKSMKEKWKDPEFREKVSKAMKQYWGNPEIKKRRLEKMKEKYSLKICV